MIKSFARLILAAGLFASASASATLYTFDTLNPNHNDAAGEITRITTQFDSDSNVLDWSHTISSESEGFWLVLTPGPNPKKLSGEFVILYGDESAGTVTAYEYDGNNGPQSYSTLSNYLGSFELDVTSQGGLDTYNFSIDNDLIDAYYYGICDPSSVSCNPSAPSTIDQDWQGVQFGSNVGLWFHPTIGVNFDYATSGEIDGITWAQNSSTGWFDAGNLVTQVPEPGSIALIGLGLLGLGLARRRKISV